ncbi:MAG: hypothetical protein QOD84_2019 [Acidobacteriaceae bacterium]|jgi:hypothetical protein
MRVRYAPGSLLRITQRGPDHTWTLDLFLSEALFIQNSYEQKYPQHERDGHRSREKVDLNLGKTEDEQT